MSVSVAQYTLYSWVPMFDYYLQPYWAAAYCITLPVYIKWRWVFSSEGGALRLCIHKLIGRNNLYMCTVESQLS